jgi:hypothetical protein
MLVQLDSNPGNMVKGREAYSLKNVLTYYQPLQFGTYSISFIFNKCMHFFRVMDVAIVQNEDASGT